MRTLRRTRDPIRDTALTVEIALEAGEGIAPGDIIMLEEIGAALVLSISPSGGDSRARPDEQAVRVELEAFAPGNSAPDFP